MSDSHPNLILRRLEPGELVLGRPVPGHVRDAAGRILLRGGQRLTEQHLVWLAQRGSCGIYAANDWPDPQRIRDAYDVMTTPDELVEAMRRRKRSAEGPTQVRRYPRHPWRVTLTVTIELRTDALYCRRELGVTTCDLSLGGFSFLCKQYIYPGTVIFTRFETLAHRPVIKGVVRYCELASGRQHRAGVQFVELDANEVAPFG